MLNKALQRFANNSLPIQNTQIHDLTLKYVIKNNKRLLVQIN